MTPTEYQIYEKEYQLQLNEYQEFFEKHWSSKRILESIQFNPYGMVFDFFDCSSSIVPDRCWVICLNKRLVKFINKLEYIWRKNVTK
jgi:hypothetical protein